MWNLKKYFLIGLHVQMLCFEIISADTSTMSHSTDIGSDNSSTTNSDSLLSSRTSPNSASPLTTSTNTTTPLSTSPNTTTFFTISPNTTTPLSTSPNTTTFFIISPNTTTPLTTGQNTTTSLTTSQNTITPLRASPNTTTSLTTSPNTTTSPTTGQNTTTAIARSPNTTTPVTTSTNTTTTLTTGHNTTTAFATTPITTTSPTTSPNTTTSPTTGPNTTTALTTGPNTTTPVTTGPNTTTTSTTCPNTTTSLTTRLNTTTSFTTGPNTTTSLTTGPNTITPVTTGPNTTISPTTSRNTTTSLTTSPSTTTSLTTGPNTITPVTTSPNTTTPLTTGQNTKTAFATSPNTTTPVTTSQNTTTPTSSKAALSDTTMTAVTKSENESYLTEGNDTAKVLSKDRVPVKVELVVRINKTFSNDLLDKKSPTYKKYKKEFKTELEEVYESMKNFLRIDINGFRNGSTICDYAVILMPGSVIETSNNESRDLQDCTDKLNKSSILGFHMTSPNSSIVEVFQTLKKDLCYGIDCGSGYSCDKVVGDSVTCKHICATTSNKCQHGAECLFDPRHEQTHCRCKQDSNYMYSGDHCEVKVEKFTMSKTNIIAIAAGAGGGVVLLLLVVIVALAVKYRRRQTGKQRDGKSDPLRSVSMDDLRFETRSRSMSSDGFLKRQRIHAAENPYRSGLPDTKYVQGREHKIMKDDMGQETYLYQPTDQVKRYSGSNVASSSYTDHINQHVYDYIDTESKFEIQRPNIRLGYLDKF